MKVKKKINEKKYDWCANYTVFVEEEDDYKKRISFFTFYKKIEISNF